MTIRHDNRLLINSFFFYYLLAVSQPKTGDYSNLLERLSNFQTTSNCGLHWSPLWSALSKSSVEPLAWTKFVKFCKRWCMSSFYLALFYAMIWRLCLQFQLIHLFVFLNVESASSNYILQTPIFLHLANFNISTFYNLSFHLL